jgi:anti-sigma regulatory factor (Ser/Thr protein kinase)
MSTVVEATLLDVDLPAEPRSAARARRVVLDALSGIAVDKDAVSIVISEAVTNAVVHAYRGRETPGTVHVSASLDDHGVEVAVDDDGVGMGPRADSPGVGLGLPLMGDLADRVDISNRRPGTRIAAFFALMGPAGPHGRPPARHGAGRAEQRTLRLVS